MKSTSPQWPLFAGALGAALAVALGAFGAHGLQSLLSPQQLQVYETASRYLMYHSLAVTALGLVLLFQPQWQLLRRAAWLLVVGSSVFCGSLYILCLTQLGGIAWLTPVGGIILIVGWSYLAYGALRWRGHPSDPDQSSIQ